MSSSENFVNLGNARHEDQLKVMQEITERQECPFCPENLSKSHKMPIVKRNDLWQLTQNQWPYDFTKTHLLAISVPHAERLNELPEGSFEALGELMKWAELEYRISAGGLAMRFGDTRLNGASVNHLHAHLIEPDPEKPADQKVRFKIS